MKPSIALRNPNTYLVIAIDAALLYLSFWLAHWLRFEHVTDPHFKFFGQVVYPIIALKLVVFAFFGLESGMWRYTSVVDLLNLIKASTVSFIIIISGILYLYYPNLSGSFSRSVFIIDTINTIFLIGLFRLSIRLYYSRTERNGAKILAPGSAGMGIPALIYGAGNRGELLLRSLTSEPEARYNVLGFLDDNMRFNGSSIHGYRIFGPLANLERLTNTFNVKELLVAMQVSGERMEQINSICHARNVTCRVTPTYLDSAGAMIKSSSLRNIQVEDLLARKPVRIDYSRIGAALEGKRVMITGAGGSIGAQLALRIAEFKPGKMALVDKCENYLHQLEVEMRSRTGEISAGYHCVDITNQDRIKRVFELEKPQYVFHAAAHKHVPMMERNRGEAVRNNIGGMKIVAGLAEEYGVERFILISTDKAVNPANIMGATKRICELYMRRLARAGSGTQYMAVRFGNVLGSNGSVEPMFKSQIENRGPVTVTHPDVERYFMTIPEAVLLILQSVTFAGRKEIYLLDMGKPVKILALAERMIRMAGFEPGKDINIVFTGLRPGEKLREELVTGNERMEKTAHPKIYSVRDETEDMDGLEETLETAIENCLDDPDVCVDKIMSWINRASAGDSAKISNSVPE